LKEEHGCVYIMIRSNGKFGSYYQTANTLWLYFSGLALQSIRLLTILEIMS
jgi:hypothetical protein